MVRARPLTFFQCVFWFGMFGLAAVPGIYFSAWIFVRWIGIDRVETVFPRAMVWIEALRLVFWPSSIFLLGINEFATTVFIEAMFLNMVLYCALGTLVWLCLGHRVSEWVLVGITLVALYIINSFLVSDPIIFGFAAILVVLFFTLFYWRLG